MVAGISLCLNPAAHAEIKIDNFSFAPPTITLPVGSTVTGTDRDDIPHTSVSIEGVFKSNALDTDEHFSYITPLAGREAIPITAPSTPRWSARS
jgi:plastocyanin